MSHDRGPEDHVRALLDAMGDAMSLLALDGTVLEINTAGANRLLRAPSDVVGKNHFELVPRDDADQQRRRCRRVAETGRGECHMEEVDGRRLEHRVEPVRGADGTVTNLAIRVADVTDLDRDERERRARSIELETIHEHVPVGILILDADRRVTKANQAAASMAGLAREDVVDRVGGAALGCLNHLDDERGCGYGPNCGACELRQALLHAINDGIIINGLPVSVPVHGSDGPGLKHVLVSAAPILLDGRPQVLVSLQDITRLREAEADVAFKAMVLDQIQDRVTVTDLQGNVVYVNDAACRSLQRNRGDLVGASVSTLGDDPALGATQDEIVRRTLADGGWQGEVANVAADGSKVLLHCRTSLVRDNRGRPVCLCGIATDVSEHRRLEAQLWQAQKLDALGRLAAGVAHDFNNQLTVISGYCDLLLGQVTEESPLHPSLNQVKRATERASSTTSHLLAFSRKRELAPRKADLNDLLRDLVHPVGKLVGEAIRLRMELSPRLRPVCVDPGALQQAVLNLIINARDAMRGGGTLVLRTANRPVAAGATGADMVVLTVEDDGHGIAAGDLDRIFEPFFTTKGEGQGTGLGLPMVRGFAEQSGGTIEMRSKPGHGTAASIVLPAVAGRCCGETTETSGAGTARLAGRVLVVEDADAVRELVCEVLADLGAEVVATNSAEQALAAAAAGPCFDLVVTDIVMPGMRGDAMAARLLGSGSTRAVVYMSGYHERRETPLGAPLLNKPFTVQELVATVRACLPVPEVACEAVATEGL